MNEYREFVKERLDSREMLEQLAEEASELAQAALKMIRAYGMSKNTTRTKPGEAAAGIVEEIGDVMMLVDMLDLYDINTAGNPKWKRWAVSLGWVEETQ